MENKNFIAAILLSIAFLIFWTYVVMPKFAPAPVTTTGLSNTLPSGTPAPAGIGAAPSSVSMPAAADLGVKTTYEDAQQKIVFVSNGGSVLEWHLKLKGREVDLVEDDEADILPLQTFPGVPFAIKIDGQNVYMTATLPNKVQVAKTLSLSKDGYLNRWRIEMTNPTSVAQKTQLQWGWGPGLGTALSERNDNPGLTRAISLGTLKATKLKPGNYSDLGRWVALDNRYFLIAAIPTSGVTAAANVTGEKAQTILQLSQTDAVEAHGKSVVEYQLYAGPKGYTHLRKYKQALEEAVDFGTFSTLGKWILSAIYALQRTTGNYGWAIVLLTMCLQILLLPLTLKSFRATAAMKRLQPQIAAIQKTHAKDPKRLQTEMMNVYKKNGTNPLGGCLPMVLQLPIFWALFTALRNAYELQGAPWMGWIKDLSVRDPLYIMPVVMGGAMFVQQRMSGAVTDPTQRQMMFVMPIMFTFIFSKSPAGLVLYWLTNNLITILFMFLFNSYINRPHKIDDAGLQVIS